MPKGQKDNSRGFTLIELLVVVTIIAIISSIGLLYYGDLQKKARDSARKTYIESVAKALEVNKGSESYQPLEINQMSQFQSIDPGGNAYCIATALLPDPVFSIPWQGTCPGGFETLVPGEPTGVFTAFKVCAYLENPPSGQPNVVCRTGTF